MREIKFRAWDKRHKWMWDWAWCKNTYTLDWFENQELLKQVIMQFTGLKDKNGKEIYEGDVVLLQHISDAELENEIVTFKDGGFYPLIPGCANCNMPHEYIEVVGNIYENPELLS